MPESNQLLQEFYRDWQQACARRAMAEQTLAGAQTDELAKEARFKGAAEILYGKDATYEYSQQGGLKFLLPNRAQRRARAKLKGKKR